LQSDHDAFFGVDARSTVVRGGQDAHYRGVKNDEGKWLSTHKVPAVFLEMFMQIQIEYSSLPTPKKLKLSEIRTYYDFIRADLRERTKPKKK